MKNTNNIRFVDSSLFKIIYFTLTILLVIVIASQDLYSKTDSTKVVNAEWVTRKISGDVFFKQFIFRDSNSIFNSNQVISIIEVVKGGIIGNKKGTSQKKGKRVVEIVADSERNVLSYLARKHEAIAAVNGSFFDMSRDDSASVTYMRIDGQEISNNQLDSSKKRSFCQKAAIATNGGRLFILEADENNPNWEKSIKADDMLCTGPLLILDGKQKQLENNSFNNNRHNRTGAAVLKNGTLLLITVDGRSSQAHGMSLDEFRCIGRWLGAVDMINLDGGGSTTMFIDTTGIINYPSDNKTFDHKGERKIANAVIVRFNR